MKKNKNLKTKIAKMFSNMCCSECSSDFDEDSIEILREENEFLVLKLTCQKCRKSFGIAFLGLTPKTKYCENINDDQVFDLYEMNLPINADDVLDAHDYIKDMDNHWQKDLQKFNNLND